MPAQDAFEPSREATQDCKGHVEIPLADTVVFLFKRYWRHATLESVVVGVSAAIAASRFTHKFLSMSYLRLRRFVISSATAQAAERSWLSVAVSRSREICISKISAETGESLGQFLFNDAGKG
jgi:hypothetical protein